MLASAAIGALGASVISNALGRKRSLLLRGVLCFIGAVIACIAISAEILIAALILLELTISVESFVVPLYLSETALQYIRGTVIASFQLMIGIGILIACLINLAVSASGS